MDTLIYFGFIFMINIFFTTTNSIETVYFNQACNTTGKSVTTSLRLEPSQYLWYYGSTSCFYNVVVPTGKRVYLNIRMFDLEPPSRGSCVDFINIHDGSDTTTSMLNTSPICDKLLSRMKNMVQSVCKLFPALMFDLEPPSRGSCVDFINIHDGGDTTASLLNTSPLCDKLPDLDNTTFLSTSNQMTIFFYSDLTAEGRGFDLSFSAVSIGSCSSSEFNCVNTSVCLDVSLACNSIYECGDASDEKGCTYPVLKGISLNSNYGLIVGLLLGITGFAIFVVVVVLFVWRYNRWKLYVRRPLTAKSELESTTYQTAYPVTRLYYKEQYHNLYENPVVRKAEILHNQRKQEKQAATIQAQPAGSETIPEEKSNQENGNSTTQTSVNLGFENERTSQESPHEVPPNSPELPGSITSETKFDDNKPVVTSNGQQRQKHVKNKFFEEEKTSVLRNPRKTKPKLGKSSKR